MVDKGEAIIMVVLIGMVEVLYHYIHLYNLVRIDFCSCICHFCCLLIYPMLWTSFVTADFHRKRHRDDDHQSYENSKRSSNYESRKNSDHDSRPVISTDSYPNLPWILRVTYAVFMRQCQHVVNNIPCRVIITEKVSGLVISGLCHGIFFQCHTNSSHF